MARPATPGRRTPSRTADRVRLSRHGITEGFDKVDRFCRTQAAVLCGHEFCGVASVLCAGVPTALRIATAQFAENRHLDITDYVRRQPVGDPAGRRRRGRRGTAVVVGGSRTAPRIRPDVYSGWTRRSSSPRCGRSAHDRCGCGHGRGWCGDEPSGLPPRRSGRGRQALDPEPIPGSERTVSCANRPWGDPCILPHNVPGGTS